MQQMQKLFGQEVSNMQTIQMVRLIADEGYELVKGDQRASCVDTFADKASEWTEVVKKEGGE